MDDLTVRQKEILARIIDSHIATTLPVGSRTLAERYQMHLSPASVRHEMGILEEQGYLTHPHTSAGRVPTDKGYHFYVREIAREEPVPAELLTFIAKEIERKIDNLENLMARVSAILSTVAKEAVLMVSPVLQQLCLRELSLVAFDQTRLLAVWCSTSGLIQNCLVEMEEPISAVEVDRIRNFINEELTGNPIGSLEEILLRKLQSRRDSLKYLYERTLQIVRESIPHWTSPRLFVEGSHYILNQPEFQDLKKFQLLIATLEEKSNLIHLLAGRPLAGEIQVAIGEKELSKDIWDCALISSPFVWQGKCVGTIGVLGPRRMPYGRIMGLVHQMAGEVSRILTRWSS